MSKTIVQDAPILIQASITQRGQLALPSAVRKKPGAGPGNKLAFYLDTDGSIRIVNPAFTYATAGASVKPLSTKVSENYILNALDEARTSRYRKFESSNQKKLDFLIRTYLFDT